VSGSMAAVRPFGTADEIDFQKQERLRELLRDLENSVINGVAPSAAQQGSATVRRTMNGVIPSIVTNQFTPGSGGIPSGGGTGNTINDGVLNAALRSIWEQSAGRIDTIVCGGVQKRRINEFVVNSRLFAPADTRYQNQITV